MSASWMVRWQAGGFLAVVVWLGSPAPAVGQSAEERESEVERREESMFGPAPEERDASDRSEESEGDDERTSSPD